jgi:predicted  nucleic acid-binding Zn-ribbon protein
MNAITHLNELDDMIGMSGVPHPGRLSAVVSSARREVEALESDYSALKAAHAKLQKAHAELKDEHTKLQAAQLGKGPQIIDNRSPAMEEGDTLNDLR